MQHGSYLNATKQPNSKRGMSYQMRNEAVSQEKILRLEEWNCRNSRYDRDRISRSSLFKNLSEKM
jgi:hypothetical protein